MTAQCLPTFARAFDTMIAVAFVGLSLFLTGAAMVLGA
jgi:hypothetical protein